jgi:hypothetical protein
VKSARAEFALVSLGREVLSALVIVLAVIHLVRCQLRGDTRLERSKPRIMCILVKLAERADRNTRTESTGNECQPST